jgi:hypothetical protein
MPACSGLRQNGGAGAGVCRLLRGSTIHVLMNRYLRTLAWFVSLQQK